MRYTTETTENVSLSSLHETWKYVYSQEIILL